MKRYGSDLSEKEWEEIEEYFPEAKTGRPRKHSAREILNGIFYVLKTGCQWRYLPSEYPPWKTVYDYFRQWSVNGIIEKIHARLRKKMQGNRWQEMQTKHAHSRQSVCFNKYAKV